MRRAPQVLLSLSLLAGLSGCGGDESVQSKAAVSAAEVISEELAAKMWPVALASDVARAPYESDEGWTHVFERRYADALSAFQRSGNMAGLARVHMEFAAVYRQGALVAVNAVHHAYGEEAAPTDPVGLQYMVGVSRVFRGEPVGESFTASAQVSEVAAHAAAWTSHLSAAGSPLPGLTWLEERVGELGPVTVGQQPSLRSLPQYQFAERTPTGALIGTSDPGLLLALSEWHLSAARMAVPDGAADLPLVMNAWRLPSEGPVSTELQSEPSAWLFSRTEMCAEDLAFLAAVDHKGAGEVVNWAQRSPMAAALAPAWDGQRLDHEMVLDQSVRLMRQAEASMVATNAGARGFHRPFALFVRLGVLRAGMVVADKAGQYRDAGILRLEALERMEGGKGSVQRDPAFALSVAAWDAFNRSPLRPEDILHNLISDFPALAVARSPLEALHLRLNRHAAPSTPVH